MIKEGARSERSISGWGIACLLTAIAACVAYLPAMSGLPIWDDHALISGNGIGGGKSVAACFTQPFLLHYFRPMVSLSFFLDHKLYGSGPFYYHQTNLVIHVLTTIVCLSLFRAAFRSRVIALVAALIFAVQPAQVSTVAWIGGRTDSLCTLWATIYALGLIRSAQAAGRQRAGWTALSATAFGLALLTKEQSLSLLPLAPLAFRCFAPGRPEVTWKAGLRWWVPYLATGLVFVAVWCAAYPSPLAPVMHSVSEQAVLAGRTLTYYSALLAAPTPGTLHLLSVSTLERWGIWSVLPGYAILGAMIALCARGIRTFPAMAWFCAFLLAAILPVCNFIPLPSLVVAPYRVGICGPAAAALLGLLFAGGYRKVLAAAGRPNPPAPFPDAFTLLTGKGESNSSPLLARNERPGEGLGGEAPVRNEQPGIGLGERTRLARLALGAAALLWFGGLTWWGSGRWQDERMIFATIVRYDPDSIVARFNLTTALLKLHHMQPALTELDGLMTDLFRSRSWTDRDSALAALNSDPTILQRIRENQGNAIRPEGWLAALYGQRGFALLDAQDRAGARRSFEIGRSIDRENDDVNLGLAKMAYDAESYRTAAGFLRLVIAVRPRRAEAHMLMGHTMAAMGRWRDARAELEAWAALQPWSGQAYVEVAQAKSRLGDYSGARDSLQFAISNSICDPIEVRARLKDLRGRASAFLN